MHNNMMEKTLVYAWSLDPVGGSNIGCGGPST